MSCSWAGRGLGESPLPEEELGPTLFIVFVERKKGYRWENRLQQRSLFCTLGLQVSKLYRVSFVSSRMWCAKRLFNCDRKVVRSVIPCRWFICVCGPQSNTSALESFDLDGDFLP